ncbi:ATP-binding protein [Pantoea sp. USHLN256]|uniref:ATP-binding protein n=1 Tax=Pantoea sp. USHLN256 TaxID=3081293 RepID=UPI003017471E
MLIFFIRLLFFFTLLFSKVVTANMPAFSEQEREWIAENRVVSYQFQEGWPLDYLENLQHVGLSREYLNLIAKYSGLVFRMANENERPELTTNSIPSLMPASERNKWRYSSRWFTSNTLIVSTFDTNPIRSLEQMEGKRVAVRAGTWQESWLNQYYPNINLLPQPDVRAVFETVLNGAADAGLGSDLIMRPFLQRNYSDKLVIAAQVPEMVAGIHIGVQHESELLLSIINKSLAFMTTTETNQLFDHWVGGLRLGYPSASVILSLYTLELSLFLLLVVVLVWALRRALLHKRRAIESETRKSQFLAMMSHEIRTPMNAMIAALELMRLPCNQQQRDEYVNLAWSSSTYLLRLLNDILDHSKLSQRQVTLDNHCFSLSAMVSTLVAVYQPVAAAKQLSLNAVIEDDLQSIWIFTDEDRLLQVINNLLSNAIKFTEQGEIWLKLSWQSDKLLIEVVDTGIGISETAQMTLFDAWTQGDNTSTRRFDGSGLGLYISHEVVELLQGTLSCRSQPGGGASFKISLPLTRCEPPVKVASDDAEQLPEFNSKISVLVIEDHPANQKMLAAQLTSLGCHYDMAGTGEEGLTLLIDENYYDVILLDCNLPDIDGYEVARRIRCLEVENAMPETPIVAISALSGAEHQALCDECGINVLLTKPISLPDLSRVLNKWFHAVNGNSSAKVSTMPTQEVLEEYLHEDLFHFARAIGGLDIKSMIYHVHRIKGVAQMYQLQPLAELADYIETSLREGYIPVADESEKWISGLKRHAFKLTHL